MTATVEMGGAPDPVGVAAPNSDLRWYIVHAYSGMEKAVERNIIERTAGDPEMQAAQLSRLSQKKTLYDAQISGERAKMERQFDDLRTALESGRDDVVIPA